MSKRERSQHIDTSATHHPLVGPRDVAEAAQPAPRAGFDRTQAGLLVVAVLMSVLVWVAMSSAGHPSMSIDGMLATVPAIGDVAAESGMVAEAVSPADADLFTSTDADPRMDAVVPAAALVDAAPPAITDAPAPALAAALAAPPAQPQVKAPEALCDMEGTVNVNVGQSTVVEAPWPVTRVSITQTDVADVEVLAPTQVLVIGNELGTTDLMLWNEDNEVWHARVAVVIDLDYIGSELAKIFPGCDLEVMQSQDVLVVSGLLRLADQAPLLRQALDAYDLPYVDKTGVAGVQQVLISVRVAEVSRKSIRSLGMNMYYAGDEFFGGLTLGADQGGPINPVSIGAPAGAGLRNVPFSFLADTAVSTGVTMFGGFPGSDLQFFLEALAENQYLRILAEPSLVALSGEEASFLAGGEFPIPVVQGSTVGAGTSITIEYKEFGIRLNFLPQVLGENRLRLYVAPEVSDISEQGAVEIEGFRIPAIVTRRAETTLEMHSGQSFAMAGLLSQLTNARNSSVPVLGDLPVIGSLFRSVRYTTGETELVVLVTASLVEPTSSTADMPVPGSLHDVPEDWELYIDGRLDGATPPSLAPVDRQWFHDRGLNRLQGPGAWERHNQSPATAERGTRGNG